LSRAIKGVTGMMHFAKYDSPLLLEALAGLLLAKDYPDDAKMLAARAYLQASYVAKNSDEREEYRRYASSAITFQVANTATEKGMPLATLENSFKKELADAEAWFAQIRKDELRWITEGKDVEAEYVKKYFQEPAVFDHEDVLNLTRPDLLLWDYRWYVVPIVVLVALGGWAWKRRRARPALAA
jgi:hypothetical protein